MPLPNARMVATMTLDLDALEKLAREADAAAWKALKKYGRHTSKCPASLDDDNLCKCGFGKALSNALARNAARAALKGA